MKAEKILTPLELATERLTNASNQKTELLVVTEYLKSLRKKMPSKQEAQLLAQQIRKNEKDIEETSRHIEWLTAFVAAGGVFATEQEEKEETKQP